MLHIQIRVLKSGQFHMRNGSTVNLINKQILVNSNVLFLRQIAKF